nr:uncharacterized protein CTRU02_15084 [Colletotrichum truncatum]KAF6781444.1 hypothetical protein CTRU02_15084 [Colletotrichum truncatum]
MTKRGASLYEAAVDDEMAVLVDCARKHQGCPKVFEDVGNSNDGREVSDGELGKDEVEDLKGELIKHDLKLLKVHCEVAMPSD